jgi:hypothetical protein
LFNKWIKYEYRNPGAATILVPRFWHLQKTSPKLFLSIQINIKKSEFTWTVWRLNFFIFCHRFGSIFFNRKSTEKNGQTSQNLEPTLEYAQMKLEHQIRFWIFSSLNFWFNFRTNFLQWKMNNLSNSSRNYYNSITSLHLNVKRTFAKGTHVLMLLPHNS